MPKVTQNSRTSKTMQTVHPESCGKSASPPYPSGDKLFVALLQILSLARELSWERRRPRLLMEMPHTSSRLLTHFATALCRGLRRRLANGADEDVSVPRSPSALHPELAIIRANQKFRGPILFGAGYRDLLHLTN